MGTPTSGEYPPDWPQIAQETKDRADWKCVRCGHHHAPADGYCLTVHHFDGDKANCKPWNLMALCQRCHLSVQARIDPRIPLLMEPSDWIKPYLAGMYEDGEHSSPGPLYDQNRWRDDCIRLRLPWPDWAPVS